MQARHTVRCELAERHIGRQSQAGKNRSPFVIEADEVAAMLADGRNIDALLQDLVPSAQEVRKNHSMTKHVVIIDALADSSTLSIENV